MITNKRPRYPSSMWSQYTRLQNGDDSTNNHSEGAHNRCRRHLCVDHPSVWRFIHALHGLQRVLDFDLNKFKAGKAPGTSKKNALQMRDHRMRNILEEIDSRSEMDFLKGIAMNIQLD